jgi:hypothetical protein
VATHDQSERLNLGLNVAVSQRCPPYRLITGYWILYLGGQGNYGIFILPNQWWRWMSLSLVELMYRWQNRRNVVLTKTFLIAI